MQFMTRDGTIIETLCSAKVGRNKQGEAVYSLAVFEDITEHLKAVRALKESEEQQPALVQNVPGMVYEAYPDWTARIITDSVRVCGYTVDELNTREFGWISIVHPDDRAGVFEEGFELTRKPKNLVQVYRILCKDEGIRWVEDRKASFFAQDGEFTHISGIVFDIKERKEAEEDRERLLGELKTALAEVKTLQGFIPICSNCKKIRDDDGFWQRIEEYIQDRSNAQFSHGICPDCMKELYP